MKLKLGIFKLKTLVCIMETNPNYELNHTILFCYTICVWGCSSINQFRLLPEARVCECDVMMISSRSFQTNQDNVIVCSMMDVFTVCYCFPVSLCEVEVYVFENT